MKLGIIGSGLIVQEFLPRLVLMEGLKVEGLQCTPKSMGKAQELCKANHVLNVVTQFEDLCALDIDTVYVAVPNYMHYDYCRKALEHGLNVIVEKPFASNAEEAICLQEIAERNGRFLFEAITTLYLGNYKKIRELLPRIGTVKLVQSNYSQYSRRYDAFLAGEILPAFDPAKAGGAMMDLGLYNLHFVMGLFGTPLDVQYHANIERNIDTSGVLTMQYEGFQAVCIAAKDCRGAVGATIQGTKGVIRTSKLPNLVGKVTLELNDGTLEEYDDGMGDNRLIGEFTEFIRAVNEDDRDFCKDMLERSIAVSKIQTKARELAGIRFPSDRF